MGNVHAYSAPAPPPPTPSASPYTKTETTTKGPSQEVENPGPLEEIHTKCKRSDYTASVTVANPDIIAGSGVMVLHYLQAVTPRLALGSELAYQKGPGIPGGEIALLSAAAKYTTENTQISGTLGVSGVHLCYYQKASSQLQIGVELEANPRMQESVASIGYQVDLPKSEVVVALFLVPLVVNLYQQVSTHPQDLQSKTRKNI
ncbi:hypothetical protein GEV33_003125 [Tenebrio molitor]|uniref:Uncharacterized protein n=1 Tax=Tenebrio molitor TaxID=7067 RepID=A0A8J6LNT7_TENMO|nr:hypothetical protein GEV33_003125 [Tenebrio molitor]